jgi:hypothetical protein
MRGDDSLVLTKPRIWLGSDFDYETARIIDPLQERVVFLRLEKFVDRFLRSAPMAVIVYDQNALAGQLRI